MKRIYVTFSQNKLTKNSNITLNRNDIAPINIPQRIIVFVLSMPARTKRTVEINVIFLSTPQN